MSVSSYQYHCLLQMQNYVGLLMLYCGFIYFYFIYLIAVGFISLHYFSFYNFLSIPTSFAATSTIPLVNQ